MRTPKTVFKSPAWLAVALLVCAWTLHAQSPPTITTQPAGQTNLPGTSVTFSVAVSGTGPFTYQWLFNGAPLPNNNNNIITTVAGNGTGTYAGDGGAATNASLYYPGGVACDTAGNIYIADSQNNRIRKVATNSLITTVAGNGKIIYAGDGGAATNAGLNFPLGIALDASNNLYIAEAGNNRIRKVASNGIISTVAGNGTNTFAGDGGAATNASLIFPSAIALDVSGNLYIADQSNNRIRKVGTNGIITTVAGNGASIYAGDGGPAVNASLAQPSGVVCDTVGNIYIADHLSSRIRKVATNGIISTVAGNGTATYAGDGGAATNASLSYPKGIALDASDNLYITDYENSLIRKVATNGIISTVAGNGAATYAGDGGAAIDASLDFPSGVAVDASDNLYISDFGNNRIRDVYLAGHFTYTLSDVNATNAGNYSVVVTSPYGSVTSAVAALTIPVPPIITVQPASQFAAIGGNAVFSVSATSAVPLGYSWYWAGTNLVQSGTNNSLTLTNVAAGNAGNYSVVITNVCGSVTSQVATLALGLPPSVSVQPAGRISLAGTSVSFNVTAGGTGPFTYQWRFNGANLPWTNFIFTVAGTGTAAYGGDGGAATNATLNQPAGVAVDAAGNLYIADAANNRIRKVTPNGVITTVPVVGGGFNHPEGVAVDGSGNLYVADSYNQRIREVAANGVITTVAGNGTNAFAGDGGPATNACLNYPSGVTVDPAGNLYIADQDNHRIRKVAANGLITTVAGNGTNAFAGDGGPATNASLNYPFGVVLDASGNLYIADQVNNRIRKVAPNGLITTVTGNGGFPYLNYLNDPCGVAVDASGDLFIADTRNSTILKAGTNGLVTMVATANKLTWVDNSILDLPAGVASDALGNVWIADTATNRIREVYAAAAPTLTLTNLNVTNTGGYSVVITSLYGSVTSKVATLSVTLPPPPQILAGGAKFGFLTNRFGFNLSSPTGQTVVVDGSTNLVNWTPLYTNTAGGNPIYFDDPASTNFPRRFYRARTP